MIAYSTWTRGSDVCSVPLSPEKQASRNTIGTRELERSAEQFVPARLDAAEVEAFKTDHTRAQQNAMRFG
jgi:hypothetical protein